MPLPADVVHEDRDLETRIGRMSEKLAKLRWHWTLDEDNPERVSLREYARQVSRDFKTVRGYAKGYALFMSDGHVSISEAIGRANMGGETESATEAVAKARGTSFTHTRDSRNTEIRRVREIARERAEQKGTTVEEEAPAVAEWIVKTEEAGKKISGERKQRLGLRFVEMEGKLDKVKRELLSAVRLAQDIEWGDDEIELLQHTLENIRALLHLIDSAMAGTADVDWDTELAKLTEVA